MKTYQDLKNKYDELTSLGTDVLTLKGDDELTRGLRAIGKIKKILDDCAARGKSVYNLSKADPEYRKVKDIYMTINGSRVPLIVRFKLAGYDKKVVRVPSFEELKERLDNFVASGKPLEKLRALDYALYSDIKNSSLKNFEARRTLFEKIKVLGYVKPKLKVDNVEEELQKQIAAFLASGGDININTGDMPFKKILWSVMRKYRHQGTPLSSEEVLRKNGAPMYSETYAAYKKIYDLAKYQDEEGFVDSYRRDEPFSALMGYYSLNLGIPESILVLLVANQQLKKSVLKVDVVKYTKKDIEKHLETNASFRGITYTNRPLLERLHGLRKSIVTPTGEKLSTRELVEMLGFEDQEETFKAKTDARHFDIDSFMESMLDFANDQDGKVYKNNISNSNYRELQDYAKRLDKTVYQLFDDYNIEYVDFREYENLSYIFVSEYPFIDQMRAERDERMQKFCRENPDMPHTWQFEKYLKICKEVYIKYNKKFISSLSSDDEVELDNK